MQTKKLNLVRRLPPPKPVCGFKKGQKLYSVLCYEETGKVELETWIVRTTRGRKATAIQYIKGTTWVKLSRRHFDWGWAKNIHPLYRKTIVDLNQGLSATVQDACQEEYDRVKRGDVTDDIDMIATLMRKLERMSKHHGNKSRKEHNIP